jgi:tripartite-type tricarboxylate transporter receptor subunit TctC
MIVMKTMKKIAFLAGVALLFFILTDSLNPSSSEGAWKPTRNVEILCSGTPGGDIDLGARQYAQYLSEYWGTNVVVNNIAGDAVALYAMHDAQPDGYTVLYNTDAFLLNIVSKTIDFGLDDMTLVAAVAESDGQVLVSRSELGWKKLDDLKAACAAAPDTRTVAIAFSKTTRIMGEMLVDAGVRCRLVDSDGGADRIAKMLGGFVDAAFLSYDAAKEYISNGKFSVLAIVQEARSNVCPDVPTAVEQGYSVIYPTTYFVLMPKNVPPEIVEGWNAALKDVGTDPKFIARVPEVCVSLRAQYATREKAQPAINRILQYAEKYLK